MTRLKSIFCLALLCLALTVESQALDESRRVVIYEGTVTQVSRATVESKDLWVTLKDLTRATRFVLKPQGMCRDELCFPIPAARKKEFILKQGKTSWFNLSEFARLIGQSAAQDEKNSVWVFGSRPEAQNGYLDSLVAPDFTLPDVNGKPHSLSGFRGKKVLLLTWASW